MMKPTIWHELRDTLALALPIVVGLASATLIGVVDTIMIAPLGTTAMAGAALTSTALVILYSALYGLISVIGIEFANRFGAREPEAVGRLIRNGTVLCVVTGAATAGLMLAVFPLLSYAGQPPDVLSAMYDYWAVMALSLVPFTALFLFKGMYDAIARPWTGTAFAMSAVVVNIPLNWVLIHGIGSWHGLGLLGAGLASLLSETIALVIAWAYWRFAKKMTPFRAEAPLSVKAMWRLFREGSPVAFAYAGEGSSYALIGIMLGWFGASALAANQIVGSISSVIYMLPLGMSAAVGIRVGQVVGEGALDRVRVIGLSALGAVVAWMLVLTAALLWLRGPIAQALSDDADVIAIAVTMFLAVAVMQVADGVQSTALGALRGLVDNTVPSLISLIAYWPIALPMAYLFGFVLDFGPAGLWIGYGLGLMVAALALLVRFIAKSAPAT